VLFVSSDYSLLDRLGDPHLGFDRSDIQHLIYAGEISPDKMFSLLTEQWGVGVDLAASLMDHFGGNIYDIYLQLSELGWKGMRYCPGFHSQLESVLQCLSDGGDRVRMRELLTDVAEHGFSPVHDSTDAVAQVICKYNVAGLVRRQQATVIGLPDSVWGNYTVGLIPVKQSIRLVIAKALDRRVHNTSEIVQMCETSSQPNKKAKVSR
jgi:hypothetical protein